MTVEKADGRLVAFDAERLFRSVNQATVDWHSVGVVRNLVRSVADELYGSSASASVPSSDIGAAVAQRLKRLNPVSHIRWALAFVGRVDRQHRPDGMKHARDFRRWLAEEYPHLDRTQPPADVSSVYKIRTGTRERYDRSKLKESAAIAFKGRASPGEIDKLASNAANAVREALDDHPLVTTGQLATEMMRHLRTVDDIAYLRYASAAKAFASEMDYEAEALALEEERRKDSNRSGDARTSKG